MATLKKHAELTPQVFISSYIGVTFQQYLLEKQARSRDEQLTPEELANKQSLNSVFKLAGDFEMLQGHLLSTLSMAPSEKVASKPSTLALYHLQCLNHKVFLRIIF